MKAKTFLIIVGIVLLVGWLIREVKTRRPLHRRIKATATRFKHHPPQPLAISDQSKVNLADRFDTSAVPRGQVGMKQISGYLDGDSEWDILDLCGTISFKLSKFGTYSPGLSDPIAAGFEDIDQDGKSEAWYADPGDRYWQLIFLDGDSLAKQNFALPSYNIKNMTLVDIDGDHILDVVYESIENTSSQTLGLFWMKIVPAAR